MNSDSTIALLEQVQSANPGKWLIHVYFESALYYGSRQVKAWLAEKPLQLHFFPPYSRNLNPIE
ncbi:transposase [Larkinella harenae]